MKRVCLRYWNAIFFVAAVCVAANLYAQENVAAFSDDVAFLTEDVDALPQRGAPGPVATMGDGAFPVIWGTMGDDSIYEPVVAAAYVAKGRVLAFGHTDYCGVGAISATDSATKFFDNCIFWAAGKNLKDSNTASTVRVAVWRDSKTAEFLKQQGFDAKSVSSLDSEFDVFVSGAVALNDNEYAQLFKAVQNGAGFITCGLGWGWSQLNPGKSLPLDHPGNRNFAKYDVPLAWTHGMLDVTSQAGYMTKPYDTVSKYSDGGNSLKFVEESSQVDDQSALSELEQSERRQLTATLVLIYRYLPEKRRAIYDSLVQKVAGDIIPTSEKPISSDDLSSRLAISIQLEEFIHNPQFVDEAEGTLAFAAGNDFPGAVPEDAVRLQSVKVPVKTATPDWCSTGLYAAPGEIVTVRVDPKLFAKFPKQFKVRIGTHSDSLVNLKEWARYPEITLERPISSPETKIANPFGGLIYIVVPRGIGSAGLGLVEFEISGGVAAPYFVRDITSLDEWKELRNNPAPWAELQGDEVIVTVPSRVIRNLDNPQALMETWDRIIRLEDEFASGPYYRERPERITCDREISAGYMHSGYPVMTHMDVEKTLVDNERLSSQGDWGFFHEFGHNHQSPMWTFGGSVEVTVNYFTLYVMEKLCGLSPDQARRELSKENRLRMLKKYLASGASFEDWKKNPFLALNMTVQLKNEFGWEPFIRAISEYRKASPDELPRNDQEKRDQWMVRLSRNAGVNLGPFFEKWGVPTSQQARDSIKDLPEWLPEEFSELEVK